ncbi:protein adenylyltransferase SelO [Pararhodobacter oceanensis]|uniref:protein adenylyltransferase SelO n=1 Tax=Pararhodobacter oceanensis TaxID=2172121 RepID=UPI003A90189B
MQKIPFDNSYARDLEGLYLPWQGAKAPDPAMVWLNEPLAAELGLSAEDLRSPEGLAMLSGGEMPEGAVPLAMAYAGHQFGGFSPQLGDGRALLVGEVIDVHGQRQDIHLKGSGKTPFSRGGDGKAGLGPVLREVLIGEAMQALGIPTTRALSAVTTGEKVWRETPLTGAVLARVASSHLRVGTFQFFYARQEVERLHRLADYAIARHYPELTGKDDRYLGFFHAVIARQMSLVAKWMSVGFIHGVMNTDNCTISGETIDYGPCAFMDRYHPDTVFSSIDTQGRYAYGNQPLLARWNLARLGECLLPLIAPENPDAAMPEVQSALESAESRYEALRRKKFGAKLGVSAADDAMIDGFLDILTAQNADFTQAFRHLMQAAAGDEAPLITHLNSDPALVDWLAAWRAQLDAPEKMALVNPVYIPRNHKVEEALEAAQAGDLAPFERLMAVLADPYTERAGLEEFAAPAPEGETQYVTYCGT